MIDVVEMVIKQPGQADRVVRLQDGATRLGRAEDNEVVLSDVGVSRRHAQVYVSLSRSEVTVEDLGSGNGTYYNGYRVQSQPVSDGDEIVIDPFVLQFRIHGGQRGGAGRGAPSAAPQSAEAGLEVVVGTGLAGSYYPITSRGLSIGRSEDRDIVIPDPAASRHHCQISPEGADYTLRDMGSANGVFVNAVRVRECHLADGDLVRIGNTEMRFVRPGAAGQRKPASPSRGPAAPPPSGQTRPRTGQTASSADSGSNRLLMLAAAGVVAFLGIIALAVVAIVVLFYFVGNPASGIIEPTPHPPRWKLELPDGLQKTRVDILFNEGIDKMKTRDHRGALQDFYRIRNADPGRPEFSKWAFAAGESIVLDALKRDFERLAGERSALETERARLLSRATKNRSSITRQKAQLALRRKFSSDPVVLEVATQQGWFEPSAEYQEIGQKSDQASQLMRDNKYSEAAPLLLEVLRSSKDPDQRSEAISNLNIANKELARSTQEVWTEAVILEATGRRGEAKELFRTLSNQYPTLTSSRAHLERY